MLKTDLISSLRVDDTLVTRCQLTERTGGGATWELALFINDASLNDRLSS